MLNFMLILFEISYMREDFLLDINNVLKALCSEGGVSGNEKAAAEVALSYLKKYDENAFIKNNSVFATIGNGEKKVLLDAHIDRIGFIVTHITEDGFLKVAPCGGIDKRFLPALQLIIHGKKDIAGTVVSIPPHLASDNKPLDFDEVYIDTGYSKEEVEKIVSLGDNVSFFSPFAELLGTRVSASALDDRSGVAVILYALELLSGEDLNCTLQILFSSEEEVGERGAATGAFSFNPDIAIAVDVSFAYASGEKEEKCGKMGKGAMIGIAPSLDRELSNELINIAKEKNIPYQIEVMNGRTGTNADRFAINREGALSSTISIPLKYMHTPVEVVDTKDIISCAELIAEYVKGVK